MARRDVLIAGVSVETFINTIARQLNGMETLYPGQTPYDAFAELYEQQEQWPAFHDIFKTPSLGTQAQWQAGIAGMIRAGLVGRRSDRPFGVTLAYLLGHLALKEGATLRNDDVYRQFQSWASVYPRNTSILRGDFDRHVERFLLAVGKPYQAAKDGHRGEALEAFYGYELITTRPPELYQQAQDDVLAFCEKVLEA